MKKLRLTFILISILALCALTLTSCSSCNSRLNAPSGLILDIETQTLNWNMVKNAQYYTIQISGAEQEITTKSNFISLEDLEAGNYEIKIKANGDGEVFKDSDWTVYNFTREAESGLKYQLINNETEFELVGGGKASGDVVMESVYRGKPVTSIADKALYGNAKITSLTVGSNVKTIGEKAFAKCTKLTTVTIPNGVTSIGAYAFQSSKALTSIILPDTVTSIAPHTFAWCSGITNVTMGQHVTEIGEYAFSNCESLTSITYTGADNGNFKACLPDSVKYIGTYAFSECLALPDIDLGAVETIDTYAFYNCSALSKIDLGKKLLTIEPYAFAFCPTVSSVSIPDSTEKLGDGIFYKCSALKEVSLGSGLKSIGVNAFNGTTIMANAEGKLVIDGWLIQILDISIENLNLSDIYGIASYAVFGCNSLIQANIKGVKYVGFAAFYNCESLYKVTFDDALISLGDYAFINCIFLKNVDLGNSIESIGNYAFYKCEDLESMTIPKSVTSIGSYAFRDTAAYKNTKNNIVYMGDEEGKWVVDYIQPNGFISGHTIDKGTRGIANYAFNAKSFAWMNISDSVEYIGRGAFYKCASYNISLPASLKEIGDYAFYDCGYTNFGGDYYDLAIPEGTEYIGRSAFYNCTNVLSITIPGSVKTIGAYAFYGCKVAGATVNFEKDTGKSDEAGNKITEEVTVSGFITLGEGIVSIGDRAFQGCENLAEIKIPNSVKYLGSRVFYKCAKLKSVTLGSGITELNNYAFYKCEALESIVLSDNLEYIGDYAFRGCIALKEIDLKSVKTLGRYSFYGCAELTSLSFPDSLTAIGDYSFRGCNNVTSIVIPDSITTIGKHAFYGLKNTTIYCESESIQPNWNSTFNSSYRPIFWNCTLSDDNSYVVSVTVGDDTLDNAKATNGISNPSRDGYLFSGWATEQGSTTVAYTSSNIAEATNGTVLYAIWVPET